MASGLDIQAAKAAARKAAFARRKTAHSNEASAAACDNLVTYLNGHSVSSLSGYMPIRTEVDILPAMRVLSQSARIGVPVIQGNGKPLIFHRWQPDCELQAGPFGAMVPASAEVVVPELVIMPLVAFDRDGRRLGYGGGFYDRTLELLRRSGPVRAVGFAYAAQEAPDLPAEPTDQPMDAVVTDKGVIEF